jgi:hypothetical protein
MAATAKVHNLTFVTRNIAYVEPTGVRSTGTGTVAAVRPRSCAAGIRITIAHSASA